MHARELVELAAQVALHAPAVVAGQESIPEAGIEAYWIASKYRFDRWSRAMKAHSVASSVSRRPRGSTGPTLAGVVEEILAGEVLTRVWAAAMQAHDRLHGDAVAEPITQSVLLGHVEARHRALSILASGQAFDRDKGLRLDHLRCCAERWTDILVAHVSQHYDVADFGIDPQRTRDFVADLDDKQRRGRDRCAATLLFVSLRAAFAEGMGPASPNADLNAKVAAAVVTCLPAEIIDCTALPHSLWLIRIAEIASDAQTMLDGLLEPQN